AVVPFPYQFDDAVGLGIVGVENLQIECRGTEIVPLRMNIVIVDLLVIQELAVLLLVEWRSIIFGGRVFVPPLIEWFQLMHNIFLTLNPSFEPSPASCF